MTTKTLVIPFVATAMLNAWPTFAVERPDLRGAHSRAPDPTTPASVFLPPALAPKPAAAPLLLAQKSKKEKPSDNKPAPPASQILKRWEVPELTAPEGKNHFPLTNSAAISDDGTRVIIDNHPAVGIWDTVKVACVRSLTVQDWGGIGCFAILAQDASHFYVRNDKTKKVEAHDARGALTGAKPQIGFPALHGFKRLGYDFAPREYVMGSRLPADLGVFALDPKTGTLRVVVRLKDIWDVEQCTAVLQRPGGDFLVHYAAGLPNQHRGLYVLSKSGKFTPIPGVPSKDMKPIHNVSLSADGRYLAYQGGDRLEVWDYQGQHLVVDWRQNFRSPLNARFTGDGRLAVLSVKTNIKEIATSGLTGGYVDHSARLDVLNIPSLRVAGELNLSEFDKLIPTFAFSPNGKQLVVADPYEVVLVDVEHTFPGK